MEHGSLFSGIRGKALVNAIVPQIAFEIFKTIQKYEENYGKQMVI